MIINLRINNDNSSKIPSGLKKRGCDKNVVSYNLSKANNTNVFLYKEVQILSISF